MIICLSEPYCESESCKRELEYGANMKTDMIVIKLNPNMNLIGKGSVSLILGSKLYITFNGDEERLFNETGNSINQKLGTKLAVKMPPAPKKASLKGIV